jgi:hypothetical protein
VNDADRGRRGRHGARQGPSSASRAVSAQPLSPSAPSQGVDVQPFNVAEVLAYMKSVFEDPAMLDELPLETAGNPGAWHAWRSYRGLPKTNNNNNINNRATSPMEDEASTLPSGDSPIMPGDWNWEGVWENRVKGGIENSLSEPVLFGPRPGRGADKRVEMVKMLLSS